LLNPILYLGAGNAGNYILQRNKTLFSRPSKIHIAANTSGSLSLFPAGEFPSHQESNFRQQMCPFQTHSPATHAAFFSMYAACRRRRRRRYATCTTYMRLGCIYLLLIRLTHTPAGGAQMKYWRYNQFVSECC